MDYWEECIAEAFEDAKIVATEEQIKTVASWVEGGHDNYSTATGGDCIPDPGQMENAKLKSELAKEKDQIFCHKCDGTGRSRYDKSEECFMCRGRGRLYTVQPQQTLELR